MQIVNHSFFAHGGLVVARIAIGALFLLNGLDKVQDIAGTTTFIGGSVLPELTILAWAAAIFEIVAGLCLMAGYCLKNVALALAVFTVGVSFLFHGPGLWAENPLQKILFLKNIAIAGGLLYIVAFGAGQSWSMKK